ncbi:hypothetical protein ABTM29_19315, partial [Acinetobacter baumannii]
SDALVAGDAAKIDTAVKAIDDSSFNFLSPSIRAWLAPSSDAAATTAALDRARGNARAGRFADHTRLLIDLAGGHVAQGDVLARLMTVSDPG